MDEKDHLMNYFRCYLKNFVPILKFILVNRKMISKLPPLYSHMNRIGKRAVNALYFLLSYISLITYMFGEEPTQEKMEELSDYMSSC
jgi:hypothetical protein